MRHALLIAAIAGGVAAALACSAAKNESLSDQSGAVDVDAGDGVILGPDNKPIPTGQAGTGLLTGLPCDVQAIIENRCLVCHDGKMANVPRMGDYADLMSPAPSNPARSLAQIALNRMKDTARPMPPKPAVAPDTDQLAVWEAWIAAGSPRAALCTDPPPRPGSADAGPLPDAGTDASVGCASNVRWTMGDTKSPLMHPGGKCLACHATNQAPDFKIAGTVYRAISDVDDCNGAAPPPPITVTITDVNNRTASAIVNAAGNFTIVDREQGPRLRAPFRAKLSDGTNTRSMVGSVTSGDCNSCHTTTGAFGAPGRVLAP